MPITQAESPSRASLEPVDTDGPEELTEALGRQVRRAVELLVRAMSEAASDAVRRGEPDPLPAKRSDVYEAAVTVMMRVVFLLFAEERGLLPRSRLSAMGYGIGDELDALDARAREEGGEALDASHLTWHRLLATSQALYRGAALEGLRLPAYGGSLFDPARFGFLTARGERATPAVEVSDRVMLEVLRAVQLARLSGRPARRISFRDIDVEQIGYLYEGMLGHSCAEVDEVTVGLIGRPGAEPRMPLAALEALASTRRGDTALADAILAWVKESRPAATPPSRAALARAIRTGGEGEDAERALRAVTTDAALRGRLRPFVGIIRRDLRNRPLVVTPGGVLVVETPSRASAGAHYTPRSLAEEVVRYALEPLVFDPGPHQAVDGWEPVSSDRILDLKVADIACGSGAFLVAAARYLGERLVEAWHREGVATGTPHDLRVRAIRTVVATCLYGADINGMAVEMCKLSLWLVSLDPTLPFSFVDDKVLHGNSLLGLTDVRQLKLQHIDPAVAVARPTPAGPDVDGVLARATRLRRRLATPVDHLDPRRSAATKRRQWRDHHRLTARLSEVADGVIAAGLRLGGKPGKALDTAYQHLGTAVGLAHPTGGGEPDRTMLDAILDAGLTPTVATDYERWRPLHWIIAVPDVMERGGFDAIIGNPPFLGGTKISGAVGTNCRSWFSQVLSHGQGGGRADLVAYFFLRAMSLLTKDGNLGLIATSTIAQGDTRETGLDRLADNGFTITRAVRSKPWPAASASLEYAAVWGSRTVVATAVPRVVDDVGTRRISTLLEPAGRIDGRPVRLTENRDLTFEGCKIYGQGFLLDPNEAATWLDLDPRNRDVVLPYLSGEDLNSRSDTSPSRWVIDFLERSESSARTYAMPYQRVLHRVRPERARKAAAVREAPWWLFFRSRPAMRKAISSLDNVLVMSKHSVTVIPSWVPTGIVPSHALVVFATDSFADLAILSSSLHQMWATMYGSSLGHNTTRYTPSDVFETFPRPEPDGRLAGIGKTLDAERREIMLRRDLGLTRLYNLVNDPEVADGDVARMRALQVELDTAVVDAYGWGDVPLAHGFHTYRQTRRWTVGPSARMEVLDRLLEENHRRAAAQREAPPPADAE